MLVMCGAIFSHIEGWTFLESVYFVVVTISTVGFGDFCAGRPTDIITEILPHDKEFVEDGDEL